QPLPPIRRTGWNTIKAPNRVTDDQIVEVATPQFIDNFHGATLSAPQQSEDPAFSGRKVFWHGPDAPSSPSRTRKIMTISDAGSIAREIRGIACQLDTYADWEVPRGSKRDMSPVAR